MTIAIGLHLGSYVMLVADTRTTNYLFGQPTQFRDDSEKIHRTGFGLLTGAGYCPLLDGLEGRFAALSNGGSTNDLLRIAREERARLEPQMRMARLLSGKVVDNTGWIFTYLTEADGDFKLRLGLLHPTIGDREFAVYGSGQSCMIAPAEATPKQADILISGFEKRMKPLIELELNALQESIAYHSNLMSSLVREASPLFPSISALSQVGVHVISNHWGISQIAAGDGAPTSFHLRHNALED